MTTLQMFDVEYRACDLLAGENDARMLIDCGHHRAMPWYPGDHLRRLGAMRQKHMEMMKRRHQMMEQSTPPTQPG